MTDTQNFGRLEDFDLRDAWRHEAIDFTPWLAANIDHLGEEIGLDLQVTGVEVAVGTFSADILARDVSDGSVVLIENQLETTDHTHLGQIMTYLAGLDAHSVIWVAPRFRQAHLSAIRWLNQHTADDFSFFAVRARLVRIGSSPFAPVFEVVEQPNDWDRSVAKKKRTTEKQDDPRSELRVAFWQTYLDTFPEAEEAGIKLQRGWNAYLPVAKDVRISIWIGETNSGIYVTGSGGEAKFAARDLLGAVADDIADELGAQSTPENPAGHILGERLSKSYTDPDSWAEIYAWFEGKRRAYALVLLRYISEGAA